MSTRLDAAVTALAGAIENGLREAWGEDMIEPPSKDDGRWCDETADGHHRMDHDAWLRDVAVVVARNMTGR